MKNIFYFLSTFFSVLYAKTLDVNTANFSDYISTYNKVYSDDDILNRYTIFKNNLQIIQEHNRQDLPWKMGINQFTDLTPSEFKNVTYCHNRNTFDDIPRVTLDFNNIKRI